MNAIINNFSMFPTYPQPSGAYLSGLLKQNKIPVKQYDLNIKIWSTFLSSEYLSKLEYKPEIFRQYPCPFCPDISVSEFDTRKKKTLENINDAINVLKNKETFRDISKLKFSFDTLFGAQSLIYYQYGVMITNHFVFWPYLGFDIKSVSHIYSLSEDSERNPFIKIMEEDIIPNILHDDLKFILMDFMFPWEVVQILTLNKLIKKTAPHVHINFPGLGFDEVSFARIENNIKKNKKLLFGYDSLFLSRNEDAICSLVNNENNNLTMINDLTYIDNEEVKTNALQNKLTYNIEKVFPDYTDLPLNEYLVPELVIIDKTSSRCFWGKCNYCSINFNIKGRREFDIDYIIKKMLHYKEAYKCNHIFFVDEACTPEFASNLSDELLKRNVDLIWSLRTRIDKRFTAEILRKMYDAGCKELWIGLETVNKDLLKLMNKTDDVTNYAQIASNMLNMCSDIGIGMHFCLLLGFPSEKEHQREELIKFFKDNETSLMKMPFFATFNNFSLMPKSFIYENPGKFGIKKIKENSEDYNMCDVPYKTIFEDDTRSDQIKHILDVFKLKLMKIFAEDEGLYFSWFNIADSAYELLLNDYCSKTKINPFKTRTTI